MPNLLDLPLELRSSVIQYVIGTEREHPTQFSKGTNRGERLRLHMGSWYTTGVWYETDPDAYVTSAYGLLGANKQLNQETIILLTKSPTTYKIDVGLMQGRMLWPTWTLLSQKTTDIDLIEATFQARGPGKPCCRSWHDGSGSEQEFRSWFLWMLEHLYKFGIWGPLRPPTIDTADKQRNQWQRQAPAHTIKVLDLNCIEPDEPYEDPDSANEQPFSHRGREEPATDSCTHCVESCRNAPHRRKNLRAAELINLLNSEIHALARMRATRPFSQLLYAMVGEVRFRLNGELKGRVDVTNWLLKLPDHWEGKDIAQCRNEAIHFKKIRGLVVPEDVEQHTGSRDLWMEMLESERRAWVEMGEAEEEADTD